MKKVKCIYAEDSGGLTLGKIYKQNSESGLVFDDNDEWWCYMSYRFEDVNRKEKLERILKCK